MPVIFKRSLAALTIALSCYPAFSADLTVSSLAEGVYLHQSGRHVDGFGRVTGNGLIVETGNNQAVLIDTPWDEQDVDALFTWLDQHELALQAVVVTHSHEDAGGHLALFHDRNIPSWTYALTNQLLAEKGEATTTHTFNEQAWVVPDTIEAFYPGPGHTMDNSVVWLASQHILFGGCFVRELATNSMGYTAEGDVSAWPTSVTRIQSRYDNIQLVVPGHGSVGDAQLLTHTAALARQHGSATSF